MRKTRGGREGVWRRFSEGKTKKNLRYLLMVPKEDMLCNMRQLGKESLVTKLDTPTKDPFDLLIA